MTHLYYFLGCIILSVTYLALTYRFWLKKSNGIDKIDAILDTAVTTAFIFITTVIVMELWRATA